VLNTITAVIPGRAQREPGIHNHDREYGFRACRLRSGGRAAAAGVIVVANSADMAIEAALGDDRRAQEIMRAKVRQ
jgi:hypothetical protein